MTNLKNEAIPDIFSAPPLKPIAPRQAKLDTNTVLEAKEAANHKKSSNFMMVLLLLVVLDLV